MYSPVPTMLIIHIAGAFSSLSGRALSFLPPAGRPWRTTAHGCAPVEPPAPSGSDHWSELEGVERELLALEEELDPCAGHTLGQRGGKVQQDLRAVEVQHGRPARGEVQPSRRCPRRPSTRRGTRPVPPPGHHTSGPRSPRTGSGSGPARDSREPWRPSPVRSASPDHAVAELLPEAARFRRSRPKSVDT